MKTQQFKCPECGAHLKISKPRSMVFCEYCGTQIYIDDDVARTEHTENLNKTVTINKTEVKIKEDKARIAEAKSEGFIMIGLLIMIAICFIFLLIPGTSAMDYINEFFNQKKNELRQESGTEYIVMPSSSDALDEKPYEEVKTQLESAGFTNIITVQDTPDGIFDAFIYDEGDVISVKINDYEVVAGKEYPSDSKIIIRYCTFQ